MCESHLKCQRFWQILFWLLRSQDCISGWKQTYFCFSSGCFGCFENFKILPALTGLAKNWLPLLLLLNKLRDGWKIETQRRRKIWLCCFVFLFWFRASGFLPSAEMLVYSRYLSHLILVFLSPFLLFIFTSQFRSTVHMSVSKPPPPPSTSHLAIPPSSTSTPSSSASSPLATPNSTGLPPPSPVKISMQEHFAINVCPGPILPIPQISDFFPRFHDYPCTPPPPREKKILKEETFNGETGGGYKDGERRGDNDGDREEVFDSDDDDSEFSVGWTRFYGACVCLFMWKLLSITAEKTTQAATETLKWGVIVFFFFFYSKWVSAFCLQSNCGVKHFSRSVCHSRFLWRSGSDDLLDTVARVGLRLQVFSSFPNSNQTRQINSH